MKRNLFLTAGLVAVMLGGCEDSPMRTGWVAMSNRSAMLKLELGMTESQVLDLMGKPSKMEYYRRADGTTTDFWMYMTKGRIAPSFQLTEASFTPLAFSDGRLLGWNRNFYYDAIRVSQEIKAR